MHGYQQTLKPHKPSNVISAESIIDKHIMYKHVVNVLVCVIMVQKKQILKILRTRGMISLKIEEKLKSKNGSPSFNRDTILWSYLSLEALKSDLIQLNSPDLLKIIA